MTKIGSAMAKFAKTFGPRELLLVIGLALLGYGIWQVNKPAAFAVPGAIMVAVAVFGVRGPAQSGSKGTEAN